MSQGVTVALDTSDTSELVLKVLEQFSSPMPVAKIRAALPKGSSLSDDLLLAALEQLASLKRIFRYCPYRCETARYWHANLATYVQQEIISVLKDFPLSFAVLDGKLAKRLADCPQAQRKEILERMIREGQVYQLPLLPGERTVLYSSAPPDPKNYMRSPMGAFVRSLVQVAKLLEPAGVPEEQTYTAASELLQQTLFGDAPTVSKNVPDAEAHHAVDEPQTTLQYETTATDQLILEQMAELNQLRRHGGLISVRELRLSLQAQLPDKQEFDKTLLKLAQTGQVWLFRHDYAASLPEAERQALVTDGKGIYYNGILLKE